jgi:hypothetical protein
MLCTRALPCRRRPRRGCGRQPGGDANAPNRPSTTTRGCRVAAAWRRVRVVHEAAPPAAAGHLRRADPAAQSPARAPAGRRHSVAGRGRAPRGQPSVIDVVRQVLAGQGGEGGDRAGTPTVADDPAATAVGPGVEVADRGHDRAGRAGSTSLVHRNRPDRRRQRARFPRRPVCAGSGVPSGFPEADPVPRQSVAAFPSVPGESLRGASCPPRARPARPPSGCVASPHLPLGPPAGRDAQPTAFRTRAAIRSSSSGVSAATAKEVGQTVPSSRLATSLKPNEA